MKSNSELIGKFSNIYIMLLYSIITKDMNRVKHFISDDLYNKYLGVVNELKNNNESQMYDELNVAKIEIIKTEVIDNQEVITVRLISRYMDYIIDNNGNYKRGNNKTRIEKENELIFVKKLSSSSKNYYTCSNCGNNLDINFTGQCPYCDSICDISDFDYQLVKLNSK